MSADKADSAVIEITNRTPLFPRLAEAWHHRQLAVVLAQRNLKVRYQQTILGGAWIALQPLLLTGILTLVLGGLLSVPSDGLPYALFAFAGTALWSAFQRTVTETSISLASNGAMIQKVYFPRILVPSTVLLTAIVDFLPIFALLLALIAIDGAFAGWRAFLSPLFFLLAVALAFAIGLWITALDAIYRDIRIVIPSILQLIFFVTPVAYASSVVPERWQMLYHLNPMVGLLDGFRWALIERAPPPDLSDLLLCGAMAAFLLFGGLVVFARLERFAVDRI